MSHTGTSVGRRRRSGVAVPLVALAVVVILLVTQSPSSQYVYQLDLAMLASIGALGLNLITGFAGQISIGAAAFLSIGAYSVVITGGRLPFPLPVIVGGVAAAVVGVAIGMPSLRLRGLYLLFSTLVLQYLVNFLAQQYDKQTGAQAGHAIDPVSISSFHLDSNRNWAIVILVALVLVTLFVRSVVRSSYGRALSILRTNEAAASVLGINTVRLKLQTFAASSAVLGTAGALSAYFVSYVSYDSYGLSLATSYIAMILIGGLGSVAGSVWGAFVVSLIPYILQELSTRLAVGDFISSNVANLDSATYAVLVILFIFVCPRGIAGIPHLVRGRDRLRPRPPPVVATEEAS